MEGDPLRQKILDAATELFVAQGFRGISMREIAQKAGLSKAGLYYHFRDKEDLFLSILAQSLDRTSPLVLQSAQGKGSTREKITRMVRDLFGVSAQERAVVRLASQEMIHVSREARNEFVAAYRNRFLGPLEGIFETGRRSGELKGLPPHLAATILLGMCFPFLCHDPDVELWPEALPSEENLTAIIVGTLFDGISKTQPQESEIP